MTAAARSSSSPDPSPVVGQTTFFSASDAARELTVLARRFTAGFEFFAASAADATTGSRIGLSTGSRMLGEHAQVFVSLIPESVLLAPARALGAAIALVPAASPAGVLDSLDRALGELAARATPVADGAMLRAVAHASADLAVLGATVRALEAPPSEA